MKKIFLSLLLVFLRSDPVVAAENAKKKVLEVGPEDLTLSYEAFDGSFSYPCKAEYSYPDNPYDYTVKCFDGSKFIRAIDLHLSITRYELSSSPRTKYEILFWVEHEGATSWLNFDDVIEMQYYESSQSIKDEPSALRMKVNLK